MKYKIEQIQSARREVPARYLVRNSSGGIVGMLEKFRNDSSTVHHWKAFIGIGDTLHYLGAFYGGRKEALRAITENANCVNPKLDLRVASISSNTNAFGLNGVILMAQDGRAWQVGRSQHPSPWYKGQTVFMPLDAAGNPVFVGCEIPQTLSKAPAEVIAEVWGVK